MRKTLFIGLFFTHVSSVLADAYIDSSLFAHSEPVTIQGALHNWSGEFNGGEVAITHNWLETGVAYKQWKLGILKRFDYELEFSPDTADFIYRIENKQALEVGKVYHLDLKARHTYSEGVRLSHAFQTINNLEITLGLAYLRGLQMMEGAIQGTATALSENDYDFEFDVDYFYSKDSLLDRAVQAPTGDGYSMDLHLVWKPTTDFMGSLIVKDLIGRIYWDNAPRTTATASSNVKEYDENGYVIYKPALSGTEGNENFTQTLPRKSTLLASYRFLPKISMLGRVYHTKAATFKQLGAEYTYDELTQLQLLYMFDAEAITFGFKKGELYFAVTSDSTEYNNAHTFGVSFSYLYKF